MSTAADTAADTLLGQQVGNYPVTHKRGQGGMGELERGQLYHVMEVLEGRVLPGAGSCPGEARSCLSPPGRSLRAPAPDTVVAHRRPFLPNGMEPASEAP